MRADWSTTAYPRRRPSTASRRKPWTSSPRPPRNPARHRRRFRAVVSEVTATTALGTGTRRQATQDVMRRWADEGITSFRDKAGRRWQLTSYAEMAVRTATGRAATEARHGVDIPQPADTGNAVEDLLADRQALAQALAPAPDPDGWDALADDAAWAAVAAGTERHSQPRRRKGSTRRACRSPAARPARCTTSTLLAVPRCRGRMQRLPAQQEGAGRRTQPRVPGRRRGGPPTVCPYGRDSFLQVAWIKAYAAARPAGHASPE
ncbi:phage minor capsid protein [Streptomyces sp. NPDC001903]|uniref:phage minor capsid protein n=1 Tax=Streptomyces sp. NPDC001903 TaxID=3364622 RepID=UPI003691CA27